VDQSGYAQAKVSTEMVTQGILLDRDGVINVKRRDHVKAWDEFEFLPGVLKALAELAKLHLPIAIVSNQAVVGRGIVSQEQLDDIHSRMITAIRREGGRVDRIFYCPHDQTDLCSCRKPSPGLLHDAARTYDLDLRRSVFVGDAASDILAGRRADCNTVLVKTGRGHEALDQIRSQQFPIPDAIVDDLQEAVPVIVSILRLPFEEAGLSAIDLPFAQSAAMD
jgi:D-glycero-D-manno-heptose 1,7-bisphosphate phosphatase